MKHKIYHERTNHIHIRYHFIREIKVIEINKIDTADNPVNMLTKFVTLHKFEHCLESLGVKYGGG